MDDKRSDKLIYIAGLIRKSWLESLSEKEKAALERWKNESEENRRLFEKINNKDLLAEDILKLEQQDTTGITQRIFSRIGMDYNEAKPSAPIVSFSRKQTMRWIAVAAIFILIAGLAWYFLDAVQNNNSLQSISRQEKVKIVPGSNKAVLTLADGSQVILDSSLNGVISRQGNVQVIKTQDGRLSYRVSAAEGKAAQPSYNTITTPRGGQYQIALPDGTAVWLNSASSITFPIAFDGKERIVKITGEAYFEVSRLTSKNTQKGVPFVVQAAASKITVLGTHFNINAYADESAIRTTLIEGAVRVSSGPTSVLISPGEQAILVKDEGYYKIIHPDIEEVLAWKNGKFLFKNTSLNAIMRQIARWYDVSVQFKGNVSGIIYSGGISRKDSIEKLLELLALDGRVRFELRGRELTVMPNHK